MSYTLEQAINQFIKLSNDIMFKNVVFRNIHILEWYLNRIMCEFDKDCNIKVLNIENNELYKDRKYIKNKIVDSLIDTNYAYFNIELNQKFDLSTKIRNFFYFTSIINSKIKINGDYTSIDKSVIQINLNINEDNDEEFSKYTIMKEIGFKLIEKNEFYEVETYLNLIYIININVAHIMKVWYNSNQDLNYFERFKHILILDMDEIELDNLKEGDKMVDFIKNEVYTLNKDDSFFQALTDEEDKQFLLKTEYKNGKKDGRNEGIEIGIKQGIEQGIEQNKIDNARSMKLENIPINIIRRVTGLDIKTIAML